MKNPEPIFYVQDGVKAFVLLALVGLVLYFA